ncbi:MAG: hypothetical protein BroJett029_27820 [Alphaproteobacteria bacterium]|nr:MAG: hypothetical protein BroJett029_27820 [Alphaproteobacteria bacterium]
MAKSGSMQPEIFPVAAVGAILSALRGRLASVQGSGEALAPFARALSTVPPGAAVTPPTQSLPVCRHLAAALAALRGTAMDALAAPVAELASEAFWTQNPNYRRRPPAPGFLDGYGYFVLAGPADGPPAFVECTGLACGLLLLAPGTLYPAHRHPAAELYVPLSGGEWQRGEGDWRSEPPDAVIRHEPDAMHAMRAGDTPLLAAYLWMGELATYARLADG